MSAHTVVVLCPYCFGEIAQEGICPHCGDDTRNDAAIEMTPTELAGETRKACGACGAAIMKLAIRCPRCRSRQDT